MEDAEHVYDRLLCGPVWRWKRAKAIDEPEDIRAKKQEMDPWIWGCLGALRATSSARDGWGPFDPLDKTALVGEALRIWEEDGALRHILEAMVLAGASDQEIGAYVVLPAEVIEAFVAVFFDVRDWLRAPGRIACLLDAEVQRIRPDDHRAGQQRAEFVLWKRVGSQLGPAALKELIEHRRLSRTTREFVDEHIRDQARIKAAAAVVLMPVDRKHAKEVVQFWRCVRRLELAEAKGRQQAEHRAATAKVRMAAEEAKAENAKRQAEYRAAQAEAERANAETHRALQREIAARTMRSLRSRPLPSDGLRSLRWRGEGIAETRQRKSAA